MKNNEVATIEITSLKSLIESLDRIPDNPDGVNNIKRLLGSSPWNQNIFGGVAYDYKAIYTYVIDASRNINFQDKLAHPGKFIRWDSIMNRLASSGILYVPENNSHYILEKTLGKQVWTIDQEIQSDMPISDDQLESLQRLMESADQILISEDEAFIWISKAFHSVKRSDVVSRMIRNRLNRSVLDLYLAIGRYYSWRSLTPHMQWWNIAKSEVLLLQPERELAKARAWLTTFDQSYVNSESEKMLA